MNSALELKPDTIIADGYEGYLTLEAWKGFQSRQGPYASQDNEASSNGLVRVTVKGMEVDNGKICSPAQVAAIHYLFDHSENIKDALLKGMLDEFPALKDIYEEYLPNITNVSQFKDHIGLANLHVIPAEKDGYAYIGFELG